MFVHLCHNLLTWCGIISLIMVIMAYAIFIEACNKYIFERIFLRKSHSQVVEVNNFFGRGSMSCLTKWAWDYFSAMD